MLPKRENEQVEFKKTISELKEGIISLTSMLNKGKVGKLYFGIKNDGSIFGQEIGESTTKKIMNEIKNHIKPNVYPRIEIIDEKGKSVVLVEVEGSEAPYSAYGRYYIRCDEQDLEMSPYELEQQFLNKNITYTEWENTITKYTIDDVDEQLLIEYINRANEVNRMNYRYEDIGDALTKLGMLKGDNLNNAGLYLFSNKKPLMLKLAIYTSDSRISFIDNKQFFGNIFECINEGIKYIANNIHYYSEIKGAVRVESPEIPIEAIREIVVNSFAHMKVTNGDYNEITITPTKVRVYNPGTIILNKDPKEFADGKIGSKIRNPLIALTLYRNKTIEAFGTGFKRVFDLCQSANVKYNYEMNEFGFCFEFVRKTQLNGLTNNNLSDLEKKIVSYLNENGEIRSVKNLLDYFGKSEVTVKRAIASLVVKGVVIREGSRKTGYWRLK